MTKFLGRNQLLDRLAFQCGDRDMAKQLLIDRGHMRSDGTLTQEGARRDNMTAGERAIDRACKETGKSADRFEYNPITNKATLKRRGGFSI